MSAAHIFLCAICKEEHNESEANWDDQLDAPVCADCRKQAIASEAWIRHVIGKKAVPMSARDYRTLENSRGIK